MDEWDGYGRPPDGGVYERVDQGAVSWFTCTLCNGRGADKTHCLSTPHKGKLLQHLRMLADRGRPQQVLPSQTAIEPGWAARAVPPPPPRVEGQDMGSDIWPGPPPPPPLTSREALEKVELKIEGLAESVGMLTEMVRKLAVKLDQLGSASTPSGVSAEAIDPSGEGWGSSSWSVALATQAAAEVIDPSGEGWGPSSWSFATATQAAAEVIDPSGDGWGPSSWSAATATQAAASSSSAASRVVG